MAGSGSYGRTPIEPEFTEADERAWAAFACAAVAHYSGHKEAAEYADRLLAELRKRRPAKRKEGPYR